MPFKQELFDKVKGFSRYFKREKPSHRINDLVVKFHRVKKVELPFPNMFAMEQIDIILGDLESISLTSPLQLATLVWILQNQENSRIADLTARERLPEIRKVQQSITYDQFNDYVACVFEIFTAIKKKHLEDRASLLENLLAELDGKEPSSLSPRPPEDHTSSLSST